MKRNQQQLTRADRRVLRRQAQRTHSSPQLQAAAKLRGESCYGGKAGTSLVTYRGVTFTASQDGETYTYYRCDDAELAGALNFFGSLHKDEAYTYVDNWLAGDYEQSA